jgi:PAS domain S-box-containing protein
MSTDPLRTSAPEELTPEEWAARLKSPELSPYWLAAIIESAEDAVITKSLEGVITSWNPGAKRIFGYTADEAIGKPVTMLIPEDHLDEEPNILARIRAGERVEHYETVRVRKDGTLVDISLTVSPIRGPDGRIIGASKIARDISTRRQSELLQARLAAIIESAEDAIVGKTLEGVITSWNSGAERIFGYTADEAIGKPVTMLIPEERMDEEPNILARIRAGERVEHYETVRVRKDGRRLNISLTVSPVRGPDGRIIGASKIARDITDRKLAERERERLLESERQSRHEAEDARREAEEASRLKDEFLATLSHELRTPLTAILGWSHMLRTGQIVGDDVGGVYETIERNARAQAQLVDDLLDVSRIITGKLRLDVQTVDPSAFIDAAVEAVRPGADGKGVRLRKTVEDGAVSVAGDPVRLQQVVWNLLTNAVKFTPQGGSIEIGLARAGANVEMSVTDTGVGIAPEFLPYVFDRFRQADGRITRRHGGLGLGLSIVRHLVEQHGGTVRAESDGEGHGSTFTVSLPSAPARARPDAAAPEEKPEPLPAYGCPERLDRLKVLIVDDEPDTLLMLKIGLSRCGAAVRATDSVAGALEALDAERFDVLISDIGMPGEDGYELIRKVRARPAEEGGRIPAVALTAYARVEDRLQALRSGFQMHVPKPVELAELVAVTASLVHRAD